MNTIKRYHNLYLLISAIIIGTAVITGLFTSGHLDLTSLRTFTYLSNLVLSIGFILMIVLRKSHPKLRTYISITVLLAITVTGIVYNLVLVPLTDSEPFYYGFRNFITHGLSFVLALVNYFVFEVKGRFTVKHVAVAMLFPAVYWLIFVSIGGIIRYYPYFFMNPPQIGWTMVFVWFAILLSIFAGLGILLVKYDQCMKVRCTPIGLN